MMSFLYGRMVKSEINRREKNCFWDAKKKIAKKHLSVNNISQKATTGRDHLNFISEIMKSAQPYALSTQTPLFSQTFLKHLPDKEKTRRRVSSFNSKDLSNIPIMETENKLKN